MEKERKTDRRTLYTIMVIKEAMLTLLTQKDYSQITVADLCRTADINRGTFYLHFQNVTQVVDELLEDALSQTSDVLARWAANLRKVKNVEILSAILFGKTKNIRLFSFRIPCVVGLLKKSQFTQQSVLPKHIRISRIALQSCAKHCPYSK